MADRKRYRRKADQYVVAVQLSLDTDGFTYRKWNDDQRCKRDALTLLVCAPRSTHHRAASCQNVLHLYGTTPCSARRDALM